jgi:preprotein translocase subunit SecA
MNILNSIIRVFVGDKAKKDLKKIQPIVDRILAVEPSIKKLSNDELRAKTLEFKQKIESALADNNAEIIKLEAQALEANLDERESFYDKIDVLKEDSYKISEKVLNDILPEAFAVMKDTARRFATNEIVEVTANAFDREVSGLKENVVLEGDKALWSNRWNAEGKEVVWDMIHYDVQLIGGIVLHQGNIAEMMTGEGKTLVATLPVYLNALTGNGVHLVTVNDYLAKRDAAWMAPIFEFHGLRVDCIDHHQPNSDARRKAYQADITYGTNNEFGFDYLRDNMAHTPGELVQKPHNYAIVDEVDSVLVDDARTPLIISGAVPQGDIHEFDELKPAISQMVNLQNKNLLTVFSEAKKLIADGDEKNGGFLLLRVFRGMPKNKALIKFLSQEGTKLLLQKTENFYMQDNSKEMIKVDEDLYYVIEEKNNSIDLTEKGLEFLSKEHQDNNFFVLPEIGMEVSRIEKADLEPAEEAKEKEQLFKDYNVKSERIHTLNQLLKAYTMFEKDVEYVVMDGEILIVDEQTGRIMDGRRYSDGLHQAIEAKESVTIKDATQTYATITLQNYFRMYSKLSGMTGTAKTEEGEFLEIYDLEVVEIPTNRPLLRDDKDDLVFKTTREKYNAVIEEIDRLVKQKRPVLVGTTSVEISELLSRMLQMRKIQHNVLNAKMHKKEADIVAEAGNPGVVTIATNMAGRGTDIKLSDEVKKAGGLAIVGTERHDSRRVDRQLRGRAGRQGDPGSSQFYVALDDKLMRLFGSEKIAKMMDRMGLQEGEVIQHSWISKSIERAQKKVEENNFGIRKRLLEYDDVMNAQREVVYKKRRHALHGNRLKVDITNMIADTVDRIVFNNKAANDFKNFEFGLITIFSMSSPFSKEEFEQKKDTDLADTLFKEVLAHYEAKVKSSAATVYPVVKNVYEDESNKYERIVVPFSDGIKTLNVVTNLKDAYESQGETLVTDFEKNITLALVDDAWKEHLREMDNLKQSVQLAVHEQKDPLLIYKLEAFNLFKDMLGRINSDVISFLFKGEIPQEQKVTQAATINVPKQNYKESRAEDIQDMESRATQAREAGQTQTQQVTETIIREERKIGRNERVRIKNIGNGEEKEVKYKQAIPLINQGQWVLMD